MPSEQPDEKVFVKYLLGSLSEAQEVEVEDRAFADPDYLTALQAAEADLIDDWVRGELSSSERRAFEVRFLASPARRSKVEFARALAAVTAESVQRERPASRMTLFTLVRAWSPGLRFAAGLAALLFVAGPWWLLTQNTA